MTATLELTHKSIGVEVRRGAYDVYIDAHHAGTVEMNDTLRLQVEPGRHTLQLRSGRKSSRTKTVDIHDDEVIAFRCTGKSPLPIFLTSLILPKMALRLHHTPKG
jgi:hypothetical protein